MTKSRPASRPATTPPMPVRGVLRLLLRSVCQVAMVVGLGLGLYLTLRPTGSFNDLWWMPSSVRHWAEYNGRLRNLPAFALLAIPFMILANGRRARCRMIIALAVFAAVTEFAQYFIPTRWCEWQDVAYGWAGLLVTWIIFELSFWVAWQIRQFFARRRRSRRNEIPAAALRPVRPQGGDLGP